MDKSQRKDYVETIFLKNWNQLIRNQSLQGLNTRKKDLKINPNKKIQNLREMNMIGERYTQTHTQNSIVAIMKQEKLNFTIAMKNGYIVKLF